MHANSFKKCASLALLLSACLLPALGFADDCNTLDKNVEWNEGLQKLATGIENKDYQYVIESAKPLYNICARAPELNYYTGVALMNTDDTARAIRYLQEASKGTSEFSVNPVMSRKIWYTLYEAENPDRTPEAVLAQEQKLKAKTAENDVLKQTIADMKTELATTDIYSSNRVKEIQEKEYRNYARTMWTGVGVGIAGLLVATGGFLMVHYVENNNAGSISPQYITGWSLFGAGLGMTLAGAITAGIGGYQYDHAVSSNSDVTMSFGITPTSAAFGMTF